MHLSVWAISITKHADCTSSLLAVFAKFWATLCSLSIVASGVRLLIGSIMHI